MAACNGNIPIMNLLLKYIITEEDKMNVRLVLYKAAKYNRMEAVQYLLPQSDVQNIYLACNFAASPQIFELLLKHLPNEEINKLKLRNHVKFEHFEVIKLMIEKGLLQDLDNAMLKAVKILRIDIAELLFAHGAKIPDNALTKAIRRDGSAMTEWLIAHGADVNYCDRFNSLPLLAAVAKKLINIASYLITHGANVNAQVTSDGRHHTPLEVAVIVGNVEMIRLLLGHGAEIDSLVLKRARNKVNTEILNLLIAAGATP